MFDRLRNWLTVRRVDKVRVPDTLWDTVEQRLGFLSYLTPSDRVRLRSLAREFLAVKQFYGAHDLVLDDEMRLTIALQACLPILNIGLHAYADWVGVVVYPGDFVVPRSHMDEDGVVHEFDDEVLGEAWEQGPVIISWQEDAGLRDGVNVVIHEFAHKLDMANGQADGFPHLPAGMSRLDWAKAFEEAYAELCRQVDADEDTALDPYACEHPAEFFAVASEAFFETPATLRDGFPCVYEQLAKLFGLDPLASGAEH